MTSTQKLGCAAWCAAAIILVGGWAVLRSIAAKPDAVDLGGWEVRFPRGERTQDVVTIDYPDGSMSLTRLRASWRGVRYEAVFGEGPPIELWPETLRKQHLVNATRKLFGADLHLVRAEPVGDTLMYELDRDSKDGRRATGKGRIAVNGSHVWLVAVIGDEALNTLGDGLAFVASMRRTPQP